MEEHGICCRLHGHQSLTARLRLSFQHGYLSQPLPESHRLLSRFVQLVDEALLFGFLSFSHSLISLLLSWLLGVTCPCIGLNLRLLLGILEVGFAQRYGLGKISIQGPFAGLP